VALGCGLVGPSLGATLLVTTVVVSGTPLDEAAVVAVARQDARVELDAEALATMATTRQRVEELAASEVPTYGISTGFGALATRPIPPQRRVDLQRSLIRSHAAGTGPPVEREVVRAMALLRVRTLATGRCGVRPVVAERLAALLNADITPAVPEHGSLGCSGDLAPLAHMALVIMGEGHVLADDGAAVPAPPLLAAAAFTPLELAAKEGLALVNGTEGMLAMLVLACHDLAALLAAADVAAAMSVEALLGTDRAYAADLVSLRPHPGQQDSAANLRALLAGSPIVASHRTDDPRVQDAYSLRCAPQVTGAARDALAFARTVCGWELASAIDNPVVLADGRVESNGNFHGAPVALACDHLAMAAAEVGAIAERRTDRLLDPARSHGLAPFLADDPGVDSGLMLAQYSQAAMVAENRRLAAPASVDSLPTSAMQEDHVSMGWAAARKLRRLLDNVARVLAVEVVTAARGLDLRAPLAPAAATGAVVTALRAAGVEGPGPDRYLAPELAAAEAFVRSGRLVAAAQSVVGRLR
jgi:histidine ammonia-lyase